MAPRLRLHPIVNTGWVTPEGGARSVGFPEGLKLRRHLTCENAELWGGGGGSVASGG